MIKNWLDNLPPLTRHLMLINVILFFTTLIFKSKGIHLERILAVYFPLSHSFAPYQLLSYMFMHSSSTWMHIIFNMIALVTFGSRIEYVLGSKRFISYYFLCGLGCLAVYFLTQWIHLEWLMYEFAIPKDVQRQLLYFIQKDLSNPLYLRELTQYLDIQHELKIFSPEWMPLIAKMNHIINTPLLGASGAIYGVLFAFAYFFPDEQLLLLFPPIPIAAKYLVGGLFVFSLYMGFSDNPGDNTAHFAHLAGILMGWIILVIWKKTKMI
jgi:membrane associated rhomboid family serine protease